MFGSLRNACRLPVVVSLGLLLVAPLDLPAAEEHYVPGAGIRLHLDNGDVISGTLVSADEDSVVLSSDYGPRMAFPRSAVVRVEPEEATRPEAPMPTERAADDELDHPENGEDAEAPLQPFETEGRLSAGLSFLRDSRNRREFDLSADTRFFVGDHRADFEARVDRRRADGVRIVNRRRLEGNVDYFLSDGVYVSPLLRWTRNPVAGLDHRWTTALRLGYVVLDRPGQTLEVLAGPSRQFERAIDGRRESTWAVTWGLEYEQRLARLSERLELFHEQDGSVDVDDDPGRTLLISETGLRYRFAGDLFLAGVLEVELDSDRRFALDRWERTFALRLGYRW